MFREVIKYDIPEYHSLKEQFKASAEISEDGNVIKVGELTATNRSLEGWPVKLAFLGQDLSRMWRLSSSNEKDNICRTVEADRDDLIYTMAILEARKNISESAKEQALAEALEKKVREIRTKGVSFG